MPNDYEYASAEILQREDAVYLAHVWFTPGDHHWNAFSTLEAAQRWCAGQIGRSNLPWNEAQRRGGRPRWDVEVAAR